MKILYGAPPRRLNLIRGADRIIERMTSDVSPDPN
jgi:hypothetical protein